MSKEKGASPEAVLATIAQVHNGAHTENPEKKEIVANAVAKKFGFEQAPAELNINGFKTRVAHDLYNRTGSKSQGQIADQLIQLLGETTYDVVKRASNCAGQNDESKFLAEQVWYEIQKETFDPKGATEPYNKKDDSPSSENNALVASLFGDTVMGSLRRIAKAYEAREGKPGVDVLDALRWGILNLFERKLQTGGF